MASESSGDNRLVAVIAALRILGFDELRYGLKKKEKKGSDPFSLADLLLHASGHLFTPESGNFGL